MRAAWFLAALLVGVCAGTASLAVHRSVPGLLLGLATAGAVLWALRQWRRPGAAGAFAGGWLVPLGIALAGRGEGDYAVTQDAAGYLLIGSGFVVLLTGLLVSRPLRPLHDSGSEGGPA